LISIGLRNILLTTILAHAYSRRGAFRHIYAVSKQPLSYIVSDQKAEFEKAGHFRDGGSGPRVAWRLLTRRPETSTQLVRIVQNTEDILSKGAPSCISAYAGTMSNS
jgi:hypothetical protein